MYIKSILAALAIGAYAASAQTNDYTIRQVRDPVQLQAGLNADLAATAARLVALEASTNASATFQTTAIGSLTVQTNLTVSGRILAATINAATISTNATVGGTLSVTGIATFAATQTVFTAAAAAAPTNLVPGAGVGINVRIDGTNYLLHAKPN